MYAIPIAALVLLALIAVAWSPVFALIVAVPLFLAFLAYVGLRPRADERMKPPRGRPRTREDETPKGAWGEPRP